MSNYRKYIDDFFREKLGGYTEAPPTEVWDDLEKRLDSLTTAATPSSPYRWLWHAAIVSVLLFLGAAVTRKLANSNPTTAGKEVAQNEKAATAATTVGTNTATTNAAATTAVTTTNAETTNTATTGNTAVNANSANLQSTNPVKGNSTNNATAVAAGKTQRNSTGTNKSYTATNQQTNNNHKPQANRSAQQPYNTANTYAANTGSKTAQHGPATDDANDNTPVTSPNSTLSSAAKNAPAITQVKKDEAAAKKEAATKPLAKAIANKPAQHKAHSDLPRFEAGVKAGMESGFSDGTANKVVISPYLQYNLSKKFALMIQPAVKAALLSNKNIGSAQQYYSLNEDGKITQDEDIVTSHTVGGTVVDTHHTRYTYTQTHNNITKTNTLGGTYKEAELPILLKYNVSKKIAVYGGVNIVYSKLMGVTEHTSTQQNVLATKDTTVVSINSTTSPSQLPKNIITYTGTPISQYSGPAYPGTPQAQLRAGYMVGFSYNCSKKVMLDALMEQSPAPDEVKGGYNTNNTLSAPYFRVSVGYKIK